MGMRQKMQALMRNEQGLSTVEYTVLLVLIVSLSVATWSEFGDSLLERLEGAHTSFVDNVPG